MEYFRSPIRLHPLFSIRTPLIVPPQPRLSFVFWNCFGKRSREAFLTLTLLILAAFCAGFIDAIAGGGGLLQVPALMQCLPGSSDPGFLTRVLGTNKGSSVFGTLAAIPQYARHVRFDTKFLWCTLPAASLASFGGASFFDHLEKVERTKTLLRPLILTLLIAVAIY